MTLDLPPGSLDPFGHKPLTRQRSPWNGLKMDDVLPMELVLLGAKGYERRVHDGILLALVVEEPAGWHMSISHRGNQRRAGQPHQRNPARYPSWDELAHARYELLPHTVDFVMHLPPPAEYIALHDTTFHLHEHPERTPK